MSGVERLAAVLAEHERAEQFTQPGKRKGLIEWASRCICGEPMPWAIEDRAAAHRAHVTTAVLDWLKGELAAEGMREAVGEALTAQLVRCTLPANYERPVGRQTHADVAERCGPLEATAALEAVAERLAGGER